MFHCRLPGPWMPDRSRHNLLRYPENRRHSQRYRSRIAATDDDVGDFADLLVLLVVDVEPYKLRGHEIGILDLNSLERNCGRLAHRDTRASGVGTRRSGFRRSGLRCRSYRLLRLDRSRHGTESESSGDEHFHWCFPAIYCSHEVPWSSKAPRRRNSSTLLSDCLKRKTPPQQGPLNYQVWRPYQSSTSLLVRSFS